MNWWTRFRKRRSLERDLEDEIAFHRAMRAVDSDPPPFGNVALIKEEIHEMWTFNVIETMLQDARYALRGLWREKVFTGTALLLLALAIGANSAMFTILKRVILDPLPYPAADRLVRIYDFSKQRGQAFSVTALNYLDWVAHAKTFESLTAYSGRGVSIGAPGQSELLIGLGVSANFFDVLGVQPMIGRPFRNAENEGGKDRVMILSHALWQRKYGGDPAMVGRNVPANGESYQIIGVMPPGFNFPDKSYELWLPLAFKGGDPAFTNRSAHYLRVVGRLRPSETLASSVAEMNQIAANLEQAYPDFNRHLGVQLRPLKEVVIGDYRAVTYLLYGAVTLLLLVACASLAALQVARAAARRTEFATRAALGASRFRLAVQMAVESGLLGLTGGGIGVALAYTLVHFVRTSTSEVLPRLDSIQMDPPVLAFSFLLAIGSALLFGLAPFAQLSRLIESSRGAASGGIRNGLRSALVVAQIALAFVLLAGAGLFVRSLDKLGAVDKGFSVEGVVTMNLVLGETAYPSSEKMLLFAGQLSDRLSALPADGTGGFSTAFPLSGQGWGNPIAIAERPAQAGSKPNIARIQCVSAGYLQALKTPLRLGRYFTRDDHDHAPPAVIVDETFVRQYLPDAGPAIGKRIKVGDADSREPWRTIVGVVGSSRQFSLEGPPEPHIYLSYLQIGNLAPIVGRGLYLAARGSNPSNLLAAMKAQAAEIDPTLATRDARQLSDVVDSAFAPQRLRTWLMAGFAGLALLLAGAGLYGVVAFTVTSRTREIGVRLALGATAGKVRSMILLDGARLGAIGVSLGVAAALAVSTIVDKQNVLFDVSARDETTFLLAAAILGVLALLASYLPGRRAASIDPMRALRME